MFYPLPPASRSSDWDWGSPDPLLQARAEQAMRSSPDGEGWYGKIVKGPIAWRMPGTDEPGIVWMTDDGWTYVLSPIELPFMEFIADYVSPAARKAYPKQYFNHKLVACN